jgi:hypothetical protein
VVKDVSRKIMLLDKQLTWWEGVMEDG